MGIGGVNLERELASEINTAERLQAEFRGLRRGRDTPKEELRSELLDVIERVQSLHSTLNQSILNKNEERRRNSLLGQVEIAACDILKDFVSLVSSISLLWKFVQMKQRAQPEMEG